MTPRYISSGTFRPISDYQLQRLDSRGWMGKIFTFYSQTTSKISSQFMFGFSSLTGLLGKKKKKKSLFDLVKGKALYITIHFIAYWCDEQWSSCTFFTFMTIDLNSFYIAQNVMSNVLWNPILLIINCVNNLSFC